MKSLDKFLLIGITTEDFIENEISLIEKLLDSGLDYIHVRKPDASREELRDFIKQINPKYRKRIKLHDHFDLAEELEVGGVQLNSRNSIFPAGDFRVSRSCHSAKEIDDFARVYPEYEYVTLSPIFNSISKKGYSSAFNLEDLTDKIKDKNVIALGGVTPESIPSLREAGFAGVAMLGCIWRNVDEFCKQLKTY